MKQSQLYEDITHQVHKTWNLSIYARTQKELRLEASKLTKEQQEERLLKVFNNRPPVQDEEVKTTNKKITGFDSINHQVKQKIHLGIINPEHVYKDPRITMNQKKQQEEDWFSSRIEESQQQKSRRPQSAVVKRDDPLMPPQQNFEIQSQKIKIKPPPLLEIEKPYLQEHLANPYIYIKKIFNKNSEESHIQHDDIWDKSTNKKSLRVSKQNMKQPNSQSINKRAGSGQSQQDQEKIAKEKEERKQFYLQNLQMREFLFKFFKLVNRLLKEKHYSKIIYKGDQNNYDLKTLFQLWADHKQIKHSQKFNPQQYISKEQFCDFLLVIGLDPGRIHEAERFFDYCHDEISMQEQFIAGANKKGVIVPKWWKMFDQKDNI